MHGVALVNVQLRLRKQFLRRISEPEHEQGVVGEDGKKTFLEE